MDKKRESHRGVAPLLAFAYVQQEKLLPALASLAQEEDWTYKEIEPEESDHIFPILYNYLLNTFARLQEEGKIAFDDPEHPQKACFNTGLRTKNRQEIYAYFTTNESKGKQQLQLTSFSQKNEIVLRNFTLPGVADFRGDDPAERLYDPNLEIRVDYDHILDDNRERLLKCLRVRSGELLGSAKLTLSEKDAGRSHDQEEKEKEKAREVEGHILRLLLIGAIDDAKTLALGDAVPQYYRRRGRGKGKIQLLLPLCIRLPEQADFALTLSHEGNAYIACTVLTLAMAYSDARLLGKPKSTWLIP